MELKELFGKAGPCTLALSLALSGIPAMAGADAGKAPVQKPNIILILSDDFGYGDPGVYGGGPGRGMPTPNLDRMASEGVTFFSFYAQPSCTPGRAAVQTGRIPNRSGMTTVTFQGQPGGLPAAEWTLASVLKQGQVTALLAALVCLIIFLPVSRFCDPRSHIRSEKTKYLCGGRPALHLSPDSSPCNGNIYRLLPISFLPFVCSWSTFPTNPGGTDCTTGRSRWAQLDSSS
jgi:hypothetical protein